MAKGKLVALLCLALLGVAPLAHAQDAAPASPPRLGRQPLPRDAWLFDLIPITTDDPGVMSARESLMRQKYLDMGVNPLGEREAISTMTLLRRFFADSAGQVLFDPPREVEILEVQDGLDWVVFFRFPETFLFFTDPDTNVVGVAFEPPRPVEDPQVRVQMIARADYMRAWGTIALNDQWRSSIAQRAAAARQDEGLLNFTLPIKLPRTLERLIGKGEATSIRISGQERISISGTSTVYDNFLGNEVQQSQSLFPTLEMEQSLRVNLDGQVGEKIKVRVSHDSDAFGSQATQVKLSFEGDEDDIIRTIRAGDIDVTLPGSRLLGIGAQRGGLFGLKVEGAMGPLDFTVLTSKEQSQVGKRNFNAAGGTAQEFEVSSVDYVKNRIFRLTAPGAFFFVQGEDYVYGVAAGGDTIQIPFSLKDQSASWNPDWIIDVSSLDIYVNVTGASVGDKGELLDVYPGRAYMETTGYYWGWQAGETPDPNAEPDFGTESYFESPKWRRLAFEQWDPILDADTGGLVGVLLGTELQQNEVMGVTYDVRDKNTGALVMRVGRPWFGGDFEPIPDPDGATGPDDLIYYFKLIKTVDGSAPNPALPTYGGDFDLAWEYMYRNYYFLRGVGIDPASLEVEIRLNNNKPQNNFEQGDPETRRRWINVFGLDLLDQQGNPVPGGDGIIDLAANVVDPELGLLQFPNATPFDAGYLTGFPVPPGNGGTPAPGLYQKSLTSANEKDVHFFNIHIRHASTSSRLTLGAFNIKEASEEVRLDGRTLTRGVDYDIDYFSGEITLTGAASELNAQSNLSVDFEVDPLFGGGRTSLSGLNLGYRLGRTQQLSSTWLLQTKPTSNRKPRLGEEPTRDWVGNFSAKLQFEPQILTDIANLLPMVQSTEVARLNLDAEVAMSIPDPNTSQDAYLDDFEAVDRSDIIPMSREGWWWASLPAEYDSLKADQRRFAPEDRAYARWYRPSNPSVTREDLNPELSEQERRDVVPALELRMEAPAGASSWSDTLYTGLMRGYASDLDLTEAQFLEFWVNDFTGGGEIPEGVLHFDFGYMNEDFFWKTEFDQQSQQDVLVQGDYDQEDQDNDGILQTSEDTGLDGLPSSAETIPRSPYQNLPQFSGDPGADDFNSSEVSSTNRFPRINGLERNQRLDSEDLNRNGSLDMRDGYFSLVVDLDDDEYVLVDVNQDYPQYIPDDPSKQNDAWRKYRIDLEALTVKLARQSDTLFQSREPDRARVRFFRIWYEVPGGSPNTVQRLQFAEMRFLGNRWLSDGIHDSDTHDRIPALDALPAVFNVGVLNNKDDPNYRPPVVPDERNNVAEKEQSLQLVYDRLAPGQEIRVRKDIPGSTGQDFSQYGSMKYYWQAPLESTEPPVLDPDQQNLIPFLWVGSDSLNYYEVSFAFDDVTVDPDGWVRVEVSLDELSAAKIDDEIAHDVVWPDGETVREGQLTDSFTGDTYQLVIRGRPDLRRVRRYYAGLRYASARDGTGVPDGPLLTGSVLLNELLLTQVNKQIGYARQLSLTLNVPGLGDLSGSYSETDAEFRGLNLNKGSGFTNRDIQGSLRSKLQNLIPTFGLDIPFSASASNRRALPKYYPDGDVNISAFPSLQDSLTSEDKSESFNFQIRKRSASRNKIIAYTLDRLSYSYSITRSEQTGPRRDSSRYTDKTQYNYDLNLNSGLNLHIPGLGYDFRLLPNQLTLSSAWARDNSNITSKFEDGTQQITDTQVRTTNNNGSLTWSPARNLRLSFSVASNRDPNRMQLLTTEDGFVYGEEPVEWLGINWGVENAHSERLSANWTPLLPVVQWFRPDLTYTGSYGENRAVAVRRTRSITEVDPETGEQIQVTQYLDSGQVRNLSGSSDLTVRGEVDVGKFFQKILGNGRSAPTQPQPNSTQRRDQQRVNRRRSTVPSPQPEATPPPGSSAQPDSSAAEPPPDGGGGEGEPGDLGQPDTSPDDRGGGAPDQDPFATPKPAVDERDPNAQWPPPAQEIPPGEEESSEGEEGDEGEGDGEQRFSPGDALGSLTRPIFTMLREFQPFRLNYNLRRDTGYQHASNRADWGYRLAILDQPGVPGAGSGFDAEGKPLDDDFSRVQLQSRNRFSVSTQTRLSDNIRFDISYSRDWSSREGSLQSRSDDSALEWPIVTVNVQNVHKWRIFGDAFTASTIDFSYRQSQSRNGVTSTSTGNPRTTRSIQPRWNFRMQNDLSGNFNMNLTKDVTESAGKQNVSARFGLNMQFTKSFDAEGALGFLRFGKRGTGSTIDMTLDLAYDQTKSFRKVTDGREDQLNGNRTYSVRPRFSYQFSRALTAGLDLTYSRRQDLGNTENGQTSFGIGFNATFTF